MSLGTKIAWNTLVQIIGKALSVSLGVLITILLTRYLGPAGFGTYTLVVVFVTLFGTLGDWGLTLITIREASKDSVDAGKIIGNVFVIRLLLSVVAVGASILAVYLLPYSPQIRMFVVLASFYLVALSIKTSFQIIFNVKLTMYYWAITEITTNLLAILLILFLIITHQGIAQIILAFNLCHLVAALCAAFLGYRLLPLTFSLHAKTTRLLLAETLPMGAILVIFTIYNRIDTIILSLYKGEVAVGIYGTSYRIYEVLVLGGAYFSNSVLPLLSNLAHNDKKEMALLYQKSFVVLSWMGIGVALLNFLLAPVFVWVLGGSKFLPAIAPLRILSLALVVSYFNHLNGYSLIALGKQKYSLAIAACVLFINLAGNLIFIPHFSYLAAAWMTFVTEGVIVLLSMAVLKKEIGIGLNFALYRDTTQSLLVAAIKRGRKFL